MDYSVYIIQDRTKTNQQLFDGLAGDTGLGEHFKNVGAGAVADAVGANILDRYATDDKLGRNGIAIRNEMISSVSIKSELVKKEMFTEGTNRFDPFIIRTITVTGNLFAPSLIEMKSKTVKNKDMAKVMAWASLASTALPQDDPNNEYGGRIQTNAKNAESFKLTSGIQSDYARDYQKYYYRRVLVTVYSDTDTQFRAVLYDKVFVNSYTEVYDDKDGNGKFTLVMQSVAANVFDVIVAGPTYTWSALSVADEISTAASQATKATNKAVETVDKVAGTNISKDVEEYTKKVDNANDGLEYITKGDITIDTAGDNVQKQTENWRPTDMQNAIDQANKYKEAYDGLTPDQKEKLKLIPDFDKMSQDDKLDYIANLKYTDNYNAAYNALTDAQKKALDNDSDFNDMSKEDKLKKLLSMTDNVQDAINKAAAYKKEVAAYKEAYDALKDDQKDTLANIPGFDKMDVSKKMEYVKKLTNKK